MKCHQDDTLPTENLNIASLLVIEPEYLIQHSHYCSILFQIEYFLIHSNTFFHYNISEQGQ